MNNQNSVSKFAKRVNNNEKVFTTFDKEKVNKTNIKGNNIAQKIKEIFNSKNYIYKADVIIETSSGTLSKTIIGRNNNYLITNENELIPINNIVDIYYQKKGL